MTLLGCCGKNHERKKEKCHACGQICSKCKNKNHFSRCCPPDICRTAHSVTEESAQASHTYDDYEDDCILCVNDVNDVNDDYEDDCILCVNDDAVHAVSTGPLYTELLLPGGKRLRLQIDSGAIVNVMPTSMLALLSWRTRTSS